jgi:uncharacterized membrane protein YedE/YeeE
MSGSTISAETRRHMQLGMIVIAAVIDILVFLVTWGLFIAFGLGWITALVIALVISGLVTLLALSRFSSMHASPRNTRHRVEAANVQADEEAGAAPENSPAAQRHEAHRDNPNNPSS